MGFWDDLFRPDRSDIASLDPSVVRNTFQGSTQWIFQEGDYSLEISNDDPRFIAPSIDTSGESGAYVQANSRRTGTFWYDYGGNVSREAGRFFVGAAANNDGRLFNKVTDWLTPAMHQGRNSGFQTTNTAQFASIQQIGQIAILAGTRASDINGKTSGTIGVASFAQSDSIYASTAYAFYGEAWRSPTTPGTAQVYEGDIINLGNIIDINPYSMFRDGLTVNLWVASGGEVEGARPATAAIGIINNGARYRKGIVFDARSLDGGTAIELASGHFIQQLYAGGHFGSAISFDVNYANKQQALRFSDIGLLLQNSIGASLLTVDVESSYTNGLRISPGGYGAGVTLFPSGSDPNIDLVLSGKGPNGYINLNNLTVTGVAGPLAAWGVVKVNGVLFKTPLHAM